MAETKGSPLGLYIALQSTGLVEVAFDPEKPLEESMSVTSTCTKAGYKPNWVLPHKDKVYSVSRTNFPYKGSSSGGIHAFRKGGPRAGLEPINHVSSRGEGGCHLEVSPDGKAIVVANITGSTITVCPLADDGSIGEPTFVFDYNKTDPNDVEAHPHQTSFDESGRFIISTLRTMDKVDIYRYNGPSDVKLAKRFALPKKVAGPRHFTTWTTGPTKMYLYIVSEKENSVRVYTVDTSSTEIAVELKQTLSTMGKDLPLTDFGKDFASEISISNDRKFLYASNRGLQNLENDTISVYAVNQDPANDEHHLTYIDTQRIYGKHPRSFSLSPDKENKWVAVANQFSQDVVIFERDEKTGRLGNLRGKLNVTASLPPRSPLDQVTLKKEVNWEGSVNLRDILQGREGGPVCVQWK